MYFVHTQVQLSLYTYLSSEFIGTATIYTTIRRIGTVLQLMHTLKYYYWAINPLECSGIAPKGLGMFTVYTICTHNGVLAVKRKTRMNKEERHTHTHTLCFLHFTTRDSDIAHSAVCHTHSQTCDKLWAILGFSIWSKDSSLCGVSHSCTGFFFFYSFVRLPMHPSSVMIVYKQLVQLQSNQCALQLVYFTLQA